jgi:3-deoxy-manno-octulosonate cytidylyltransferase (CMP-KDO synthetase)
MSVLNYALIIPARYASSRFEGKPLVNISGIPMIIRTYSQCIKVCPPEKVFVACDDERIKSVCEEFGISVIMTSKSCLTGTDRIAECVQYVDADNYINVQGDEPIFNPSDIENIIENVIKYPNEILNGFCEIDNERLFRSQNIPKVTMRKDGRLLYMSRSAIPNNKQNAFVKSWRQICIYAFPKIALQDFTSQKNKTPLENIEDIEILRFLELGWDVRMIELSSDSISVDLPEHVELVENAIKQRGL